MPEFLRWALCQFCNGNGCRQCGWLGETHIYDETAYRR